ncbi:MAG: ATP-binding cassette domain-containing protein [Planctomycetaceae bacterium]
MIRVVDVTQHYGVKPVLQGIRAEIPDGTRTVIIGPNGMGKTTLLGVLGGVLSPQHGHVEINGLIRRSSAENERAIRRQAVYLPDRCWLPKDRTGREFILAVGRLYDIPDDRLLDHADRLLALFDLEPLGDTPIRSYSAGQQKKIALSSALITEASILLLDEPFSGGLDPAGILALKHLLRHATEQQGRTVVLTTPVPELVEEIADRLIILQHGRVLWDGSLRDLRQRSNGRDSFDEILQRMIFPETLVNIETYFSGEAP